MSVDWWTAANLFVLSAMLVSAVLGLAFAAIMPGVDRWSKHFFMSFFAILALDVGTYFAEYLFYSNPAMLSYEKVAVYFESLIPSILMFMLTVYLTHCCGEDWRKSALLRAVIALWTVYFVCLNVAQLTTLFYYYTPDNQFQLGPWYPLAILPVIAYLVLTTTGVIRRRNKLSQRRFHAFLIFLVPVTITLIVHVCSPSYLLVSVGITISALAMFAIVELEQIEQYIDLQRETARQRAKIAVLQMRPHFIHNTMTSIYYLCDQDPKEAQRVTMDFNTYLRKNFTAIASEDVIPFSEELEHTRAYLAVEQAQFAHKLVVDFDVTHTEFRLPPLTLQPLAENAVKHGMRPDTVPLRVTIRTRQTSAGSQIVVEDNGPGFDPAVANNPRTTLANIQQRLELMCGGRLDIGSRTGGGTVVRVTIPPSA